MDMAEVVFRSFVGESSRCILCGGKPEETILLSCSHRFCLDCHKNYTLVLGDTFEFQCPNGCQGSELNLAKCSTNSTSLTPEGENICNGQKEFGKCNLQSSTVEVRCSSCDSDDVVATACCDECEGFLCDECVHAHAKLRRLMKSHQVVPLEDLISGKARFKQRAKRCATHTGEKLSFYCETCRIPICSQCALIEHVKPDHTCVELQTAQRNFENDLEKLGARCEAKVSDIRNQLSLIEKNRHEAYLELETVEKIINSSADAIIAAVNSNRERLLADFGGAKRVLLTTIDRVYDDNNFALDRLSSASKLCRNDNGKVGLKLEQCKADIFKRIDEILTRKLGSGEMDQVKEYIRRMGFKRSESEYEQAAAFGELFHLSEWEKSCEYILNLPVSSMTAFPDGRIAIASADDEGVMIVLTDGSKERVLDGVKVKQIAALSDGQFVIIDHEDRLRLFTSEGQENPDISYDHPVEMPEEAVPVCVTEDRVNNSILVGYSGVPACYEYPIFGGKSSSKISTRTVCPKQLVITRDDDQERRVIIADSPNVVAVDDSGSILWQLEENGSSVIPAVLSDHVFIASTERVADTDVESETTSILTIDLYNKDGELIESLVQGECIVDDNQSENVQMIVQSKAKLAVSIGNHCLFFNGPQTLGDIAEENI